MDKLKEIKKRSMVNGLKKNEVKITKMCCSVTNYKVVQISNGKGALPEGDGSAGIPGYDVPLVLICFGLMSFGIVMAIKRRRVA